MSPILRSCLLQHQWHGYLYNETLIKVGCSRITYVGGKNSQTAPIWSVEIGATVSRVSKMRFKDTLKRNLKANGIERHFSLKIS